MQRVEIEIFTELLHHIGQNAQRLPQQQLTGFLPSVGVEYTRELMVVGRAPNGWASGWLPQQLQEPSSVQKVLHETIASVTPPEGILCPRKWVVDLWGTRGIFNTTYKAAYDPNRSAFWRTIRQVVERFQLANIHGGPWSSCIAYSNLYKIAPANGGNPSQGLSTLQLLHCQRLLDLEISIYKPKKILFLTGWLYWAKDLLPNWTPTATFSTADTFPAFELVKAIGHMHYGNDGVGKMVVAAHPQCKNESNWVNEVVRAFQL